MVKPGAALLDVGVSRLDGKLAGDVHPDVWEVAGAISPNPGGVGPLTRAFLLSNVVERCERGELLFGRFLQGGFIGKSRQNDFGLVGHEQGYRSGEGAVAKECCT